MAKKAMMEEQNRFINSRRHILNKNSSFAAQEAYKSLRTNIRFCLQNEKCRCISITSPISNEGKSLTILNLAISVAEDGQKVLLIDADLRRPALARLLVEKPDPGLSNVLAGQCDADEAVRENLYPNLDIIFAGDVPPNPSELLGSERMGELIKRMSEKYDYILVDTPPVNVVSDASIVTSLLDGVLLVVRYGRSRKDEVKRALQRLELTGIKPLGFVLNDVAFEDDKSYGYSYGYGYGNSYSNEPDK